MVAIRARWVQAFERVELRKVLEGRLWITLTVRALEPRNVTF